MTCETNPATADRLPATLDPALFRRQLLRSNRRREKPSPVCRDCRYPFMRDDGHFLFSGRCWSCADHRLEHLIRKLVKRLGRKKALKRLRALAS